MQIHLFITTDKFIVQVVTVKGGIKLQLSDDRTSVTELWRDESLDDKNGRHDTA